LPGPAPWRREEDSESDHKLQKHRPEPSHSSHRPPAPWWIASRYRSPPEEFSLQICVIRLLGEFAELFEVFRPKLASHQPPAAAQLDRHLFRVGNPMDVVRRNFIHSSFEKRALILSLLAVSEHIENHFMPVSGNGQAAKRPDFKVTDIFAG